MQRTVIDTYEEPQPPQSGGQPRKRRPRRPAKHEFTHQNQHQQQLVLSEETKDQV